MDSFSRNARDKTGKFGYCKPCADQYGKAWRRTLHGCLVDSLNRAHHNTRGRNTKGRDLECTLTKNDMIQMYKNQGGLCYYSGMRMGIGSKGEEVFKMSLERKDDSKGYTVENTCLIIWGLNAAHGHTVNREIVEGWRQQWRLNNV